MDIPSPAKSTLTASILIIVFGFLAFGSTLRVGFLWDDHEMIENNQFIVHITPANLQHLFTHDAFEGKGDPYYRPLQLLSYMIDVKIWGLRPFGFHLTNFCLHLGNALLLLFLLRRLFDSQLIPFITALLFSVHPINVEQVLIISGRGELMATAFILSGLLLSLRRDKTGFLGALTCFLGAFLSKETGLAFPAYVWMVGVLAPEYKQRGRFYLACGIMALLYIYFRTTIVPPAAQIYNTRDWLLFPVRDLPAILITYLRILVFPVDLHSHRRMVFSLLVRMVCFVLMTGLVSVLIYRGSRLLWFAFGWFLLALLPKFPILATNALMLDHWAYLAAIPISLLTAAGTVRLSRYPNLNQATVYGGMGLILLFWMSMSIFYATIRNTDRKMYEWALRFPSSSIVRYNLGLIEMKERRFLHAQKLFEESLQMNPDNPAVANGLALNYWKMNQKETAVQILDEWVKKKPGHLQSYFNRAVIRRGSLGLDDVNFILAQDPRYLMAWVLKGELLLESGDVQCARAAFEEALRIQPHIPYVTALLQRLKF